MAWCGRGSAGEKTPFRCLLDAARYTAASMVTVLILVVIVKAMKVVLFPESLYVSVAGGSISVAPFTRPAKPGMAAGPPAMELSYTLELRIYNPRRPRMYFVEVIAYLFENDTPASSSLPLDNCFAAYAQDDGVVPSQVADIYSILFVQDLSASNDSYPQVVYSLYNNESAGVRGVTMRMDATLVTEELTSSGFRLNSSRKVQYYCWPLVVIRGKHGHGAVHEELEDDVFCRDAGGTHFI